MTDRIRSLGNLPPSRPREFVRREGAEALRGQRAEIAEEVPVALVYGGRPHVVMMCSPMDLEDLAVGFTLSEDVVANAGEIGSMEVVRHSRGIEIQMELPAEAYGRLAQRTRAIASRTGCGLCGIDAIEDAIRSPRRVESDATFAYEAVVEAGAALARMQPLNNRTFTVHGAAFALRNGDLAVVREDVGRHNALDKVIGALARSGVSASTGFFVVTSRASYEMVQKAATAGAPLLAAVSRPTGLAIDFAAAANVTLVGLLRGSTANVYTHPERIDAG